MQAAARSARAVAGDAVARLTNYPAAGRAAAALREAAHTTSGWYRAADRSVRALPAVRACASSVDQIFERIDAGLDPARAERAGLIASSALHGLVLATIVLAYLLSERGGGSAAMSTIAVDVVSEQSASNNAAAGRGQLARMTEQAAVVAPVQVSPMPLDTALAATPLVPLDSGGDGTAQSADAASDVDAPIAAQATPPGDDSSAKPVSGGSGTTGTPGLQAGTTAADSLRQQMARCWAGASSPVGSAGAGITLQIFLSADGSIAQPPQVSPETSAAAAKDSTVRQSVDAAMRAIYICAPYRMPSFGAPKARDLAVTFAGGAGQGTRQ